MKFRTRKATKQTLLLCTVSLLALAADFPHGARAQSNLPAVTVDAPQPQQRARSAPTTSSRSTARATRRANRAATTPPQAAPMPSVHERIYAGTNSYVAGQSSAASKTDTPLIDTPRSVSVIDRKELDDRGVTSIPEAVRYSAGVTTGGYGYDPRFDQIYIRGFSTTTLGDFRDGLKQFPAGFSTFRTEPYQLDRVEIIKGPAAVLYGQSVPGGLVDRRSKFPVENQVNEIAIQAGTFDRFQTAFDIGGAASPDKSLLYRLVGVARSGDTNFDVADQRLMLAPSLTWRPTADTTLTTYALVQKDETDSSVAALNRNGKLLTVNGEYLRASDPKYDYLKLQQVQTGYKLEHRFDDVFTFRQHTRFSNLKTDSRYLSGSFANTTTSIYNRAAYAVGDEQTSWQTDNNLQADFATGPVAHRVLAGVNYDHNVWDFQFGGSGVQSAYALDISNPTYGIAGATPAYTSGSRSTQEQVGVYLQDQMRLGGWHLSLAGRHDWADQTRINTYTNAVTGQRNDSAFSYSAGLLYHFDNGVAPYVSYATSFQPTTSMAIDGSVLAPSEGEQFEAGVKYQPRADVLLTASVYDLTEKNAAKLAGYVNGVAYYASVGEIHVQGVELEARARLTPELETVTAYTFSDAEITKTTVASELNKVPAVTPKHTASSWLNYSFLNGPLDGLGLGVGVRYIDATWTSNANTDRNNGYTLVDLAMRYDLGKLARQFAGFQASVNANNIADEQIAVCNAGYCYLSQGRTVIGTLRYRW
ncbi:TonB-dependent siderophore receptor [Rhodopseudomonas palustris HaA2]|uniref:TonB-dependent siderophore receptor n=1 Tax=Rhodopseudomonas palustris (strain HaA2) TaxID=316058 RepID=Q2IWQ4_RHOP2|nr:TonB-dependent siderophore receptor [Rhodopseudomonas palustris]ABD07356.1 TonB-dependent siderophore receptor [Rhodopseudomonas palustris HaA2]